MSWLDDLLGYKDIQLGDGTTVPRRTKLRFVGATIVDNPTLGTTDIVFAPLIACTITSPSSSAVLPKGTPVTITGTTSQLGTVVVKLSGVTLGNATMSGLTWTYSWTPQLKDVENAGKVIVATVTAAVGGATADSPAVPVKVSYLGAVATRASVPNNFGASTNPYTNRTYHETRDAITAIQVAWANKCINNTGEVQNGTMTTLGQIEYPAGTFTPLTWSSASSVVAAAGTMPVSDVAAVAIPANTGYWIVSKLTGSVNVLYADGTQKLTSLGDAQQSGGTDMHNVVDNGGNITFPSLIIATTTKRSILGVGDSRFVGLYDQTDATRKGNNGDFQTAFAPNYACTRYAGTGLTANNFNAGHALASLLAPYHTDCLYALDINDIVSGTGTSSLRTLTTNNITVFTALGLRVSLLTSDPAQETPSTDSWETLANQTVSGHDAVRVTQNTDKRTGFYTGALTCFEITDLVETARNSGKWKFDGTPLKYTQDGAHRKPFSSSLSGPFTLP